MTPASAFVFFVRLYRRPARISRLRSSSDGRGCVGLHDLDLDPVQVIAGRVASQGMGKGQRLL